MDTPFVITGASALTPYGLGVTAYANGAAEAAATPQPIAGAYTGDVVCTQVPPYDAKQLLAVRSISAFDRLTLHVCVTVDQLLKQLGLADPANRGGPADDRIGLVLGSSGPIQSIVDFDLQTIADPRYVQPSLYPNVVFNVPASHAAIRHRIRGSCITLTDGNSSALKAFSIAIKQLESGRIDISLAGGAEEATPAYALYRSACASQECQPCPALAEGAAIFALERAGAGRVTDLPALAGIFGCAHVFSPDDPITGLRHCLDNLDKRFPGQLARVSALIHPDGVEPAALALEHIRAFLATNRLGDPGAMTAGLNLLDMLIDRRIAPGELVLLVEADRTGSCAVALVEKRAMLPSA
jgi:3-oxoacyl-[acyl-carrier-protein] synthase II